MDTMGDTVVSMACMYVDEFPVIDMRTKPLINQSDLAEVCLATCVCQQGTHIAPWPNHARFANELETIC